MEKKPYTPEQLAHHQQMFGCSKKDLDAALDTALEQTPDKDKNLLAVSMLSDVQEQISIGGAYLERARQGINRVKHLLVRDDKKHGGG